MNILFYTPVNFRCRDIESLAKKYRENGHTIFLISQCEAGALQNSFLKLNAIVTPMIVPKGNSLVRLYKSIQLIISFCKRHKIDLLFSHLEPTNFVSVIAQYFITTRVVIYRHHVDLAKLQRFDNSITYKLTYLLARNIISVSEEGKRWMVEKERIDPKKIEFINLGYDFSLYGSANADEVIAIKEKYGVAVTLITVGSLNQFKRPELIDPKKIEVINLGYDFSLYGSANADEVIAIKEKYGAAVTLITVGSLNQFKRPELSIKTLYELRQEGIDATLLFLGTGELEEALKKLVNELGLNGKVFFLGYKENILDYLTAADMLLHPSISESSCVVVKESGLVQKPVVVCKGVGDFDNYLENDRNAIVVNRDDFVNQSVVHIKKMLSNREQYRILGVNLHEEIINRFSIDRVFNNYSKFSV